MNKKQKTLTNKGFSLVELIIVMAIMAVLVGALAPQYVKYLDKSKVSVDTQVAGAIQQAMTITLIDPAIDEDAKKAVRTATTKVYGAGGTSAEPFWDEINEIMGVSGAADMISKLELDTTTSGEGDANVSIGYDVDSNDNVTVTIKGGKYKTKNLEIEVK